VNARSFIGPVIAGVDGTERSADGIALADLLAERLGAPLLLVHTHPYSPLSRTLEQQQYEQMVRSTFDSTLFQVQALIGEDREREMRVIAADSPAAGLQRIADREQAQLIVVGPSHRSGLGRVRPGSVGERLLSGAPVPVAIAPRGYADEQRRLKHLTAGFDGSPESNQALQWAANLTRTGDSRLRMVSVHTPIAFGQVSAGGAFAGETVNQALRRDLSQQHAAAIASYGNQVDGAVRDGDAATVLVDASRDADLLILGSRGYGPLHAVLLGSVSQAVIRHATCPVVVVPRSATETPGPRPWTARFPQSRVDRQGINEASTPPAGIGSMRAEQRVKARGSGVSRASDPLPRLEPLKLDDRCLRVLRDRA
jgi:nucleotide-binding universal stress UspA family protein